MVGQKFLIDKLKIFNTNPPHTTLLIGDSGSGRHTIVNDYISKILNLDVCDITSKISLETITNIVLNPIPTIYLINCDKISIKEQNVLLKFLEEPLNQIFIILICQNKNLLLDTVINRCNIFTMDKYSDDELLNFTNDVNIIKYIRTPGSIINATKDNVVGIRDLCEKLLTKANLANYGNIITVSNSIGWSMEEDKYNIDLFKKILIRTASDLFRLDKRLFSVYNLTNDTITKMNVLHVDQRRIFEEYLILLKELLNGIEGLKE